MSQTITFRAVIEKAEGGDAFVREYVQWIEEAKRDATRHKRIGDMVEMLRQGKRGR